MKQDQISSKDANVLAAARSFVCDLSEAIARRAHGDELCDAALAAFESASDEALKTRIYAAKDPWHEMVAWFKGSFQ